MSYQSIFRSSVDSGLRERIIACTVQEAWNNVTASESQYGKMVQVSSENAARMLWPVCIAPDVEVAYEYALNVGMVGPGGDPSVITDELILANVQSKWPPDPVV